MIPLYLSECEALSTCISRKKGGKEKSWKGKIKL